jgi:acetamidase/formamidase
MAIHADLDEAAKIAARDMVDFPVQNKGLDLADASMVASAAMDLVVTQAVDCVKGIHRLMPKAAFQKQDELPRVRANASIARRCAI